MDLGETSRSVEPELTYFELQAYVGTTKHLGGFATTQELVALCHVTADTYVLDVGCGVGATTCHLARAYGCRVVGVDLRPSMIARANERARREKVEDRVEFRVADAQELPFADATFDAVLCESVATFIEDKARVIGEYARVTAPGGYVGLNEEFWIQPPPDDLIPYVKRSWGIEPDLLYAADWVQLLQAAGLREVVTRTYTFDARRESTQLKRYRVGDTVRMFYRTLSLYVRSKAFRRYMAERRRLPKNVFEYLGYGLFAGVR
jgi:SAM-dependent methyltransferase